MPVAVQAAGSAVLVVAGEVGRPAEHGLAALESALAARGWTVRRAEVVPDDRGAPVLVAGLASRPGPAAGLLKVLNVSLPARPEALAIQRTELNGNPAVVLAAADSRGLMYAALETAERIAWSRQGEDPFQHVIDTVEAPSIEERAVSMYTMQRAWFEKRLHDAKQWERYFDLLAESRLNSFVVVFGYENGGFMAPPYPFFFDVGGFPGVEMVGLTPEQQQRNASDFRRMIAIAHERGVDVVPAIWDHIYRGGVQGGGISGASELAGKRVPGLVSGVTTDNLVAYNQAAIRRFLEAFPDIDGLQFRMHGESGLKRGEIEGFWHEVFQMIKSARPDLRLDLRAKELPDAVIRDGLEQGLKVRVATKYWMEQMGLPFHPTHVNPPNQHDRRHGYADLLRFPQTYRVHWRLWNGGTSRLLLWGDPEYVRRFAESARLYDGNSFEVNEMLATWMLGEPHDAEPRDILEPAYRHYDYPFERYWHFFQVWGRVGYNPRLSPEVWEREFEKRFGGGAGPLLMNGLHLASRVLPRIVAASYPYRCFPTTRGWAEMMRLGDLPQYAGAEGSDVQQFQSMRDHARGLIDGDATAMRTPADSSRWFAAISRRILDQAARAEEAAGDRRGPEFIATVTDLRILAGLARYHSLRLPAGVAYNLYRLAGDLFALDDAIRLERQAVEAWDRMVQAAGAVYSTELPFGVHRVGFSRHWKEELEALRRGLDGLLQEQEQARPRLEGDAPAIAHVPVRVLGTAEPLVLRATIAAEGGIQEAAARVIDAAGRSSRVALDPVGPGRYRAEVPLAGNPSRLSYALEAVSRSGRRTTLPARPGTAFEVLITDDREPPRVQLERVPAARAGSDLAVSASVDDPSGLLWVRLRYRRRTQFEDYQTLEMVRDPQTGLHRAAIPGAFIGPEWDLIYFLEAVDRAGNGRIYPDLEAETPYIFLPVER